VHRILVPILFNLMAMVVLPAVQAEDKKEKPKFKLTDPEQKIFDLTNAARKKEKLPALTLNQVLCEVARAHSANMAKQGKLSHELDGKKPPDRVKAAGYQAAWGGENVGASNEETPETAVFKMWMESPLHKANILKDKYTEIGIGLAKDENGETYYTQVFATPKRKR
jgi:uncharacterized protein YkwD